MNPHKSKKGLSAVIIIIIILIIAALGAGGYFAYTNYIEPMMNPYSKLIPAGLKEYAKGKNAEAFVIIKNDQDIKDEITKSSPEAAAQANTFEAAIAVVNTTKLSGAIVMLFSTPEKATELKTMAESQKQSGAVTFTFEQKDKVLIASFGGGLDAMEGPLLDNPAIKKLDPTMLDSQLIAYAATSQMAAIGSMLENAFTGGIQSALGASVEEAFIPTAHAQAQGLINPNDVPQIDKAVIGPSDMIANPLMLLSTGMTLAAFMDDATIYARYKNMVFDIKVDIMFLEKNALTSAPLIRSFVKEDTTKITAMEKSYDDTFASIQPLTAELQKLLDEQTKSLPGSTAKLSYDNLKLTLAINFPKDLAEKQVQGLLGAQLSAPAKGRDAARKAHLNAIVTAIEAYNIDNGKYPAPSACLENMSTDLKKYLQGGEIPAEVKGYELKMDNCESNYYYQTFGSDKYVLWTKMDLPADGNTSITPTDFEKGFSSGNIPAIETSGTYYMLNRAYFSTQLATTTTATSDGTNDAARKTDLNTIATAIEAYKLDTGNYPDQSVCTNKLPTELSYSTSKYFSKGKMPTDPDIMSRTIGRESCWDGYYYQYFNPAGYALWAKMDDPANGNTSLSPDLFLKAFVASAPKVPLETSGTYYVKTVLAGAQSTTSSSGTSGTTTVPVKRVKRSPVTTTSSPATASDITTVKCEANPNPAKVGEKVYWIATVVGPGFSSATYKWGGDAEGLGTAGIVMKNGYSTAGTKKATISLTYTSGTLMGMTTSGCSLTVNP